jgi:hypothetical protein
VLADAQKIWASRKFDRPGNDGRFGPGVYFWENSVQAAINWVRIYYRTDDYGILRASVHSDSFLDLLTNEHFNALLVLRNRIARDKGCPVDRVKVASVLDVLRAAGVIDGVRLIAGINLTFATGPENTSFLGPIDSEVVGL